MLSFAGSKSSRFYHHAADLRDPDKIQNLYQSISEQFSRGPDVLVNSAGIQHVDPVEECPVEKWNEMLAIHLSAAFHTIRLALPEMRQQGIADPSPMTKLMSKTHFRFCQHFI